MWRCLRQFLQSSSSQESIVSSYGARTSLSCSRRLGGSGDRSSILAYFLTVGSDAPTALEIEAIDSPPLASCVYPPSRPRRSFLSGPPHVANRGNDIVGPIAGGRRAHAQSRKNFVLRPETFRRSTPQLRGYQTQVIRNGCYGSAVRAGTETADEAIRKPRNDLYPRREIISGAT